MVCLCGVGVRVRCWPRGVFFGVHFDNQYTVLVCIAAFVCSFSQELGFNWKMISIIMTVFQHYKQFPTFSSAPARALASDHITRIRHRSSRR